MGDIAPSDHELALCVAAPSFDLFGYFCGQLEQKADAMFALEQYEAREVWLAQAIAAFKIIYQLAEDFAPENLAELASYLSWRVVLLSRRGDGTCTIHPTIQ